jgi:hypothetical protein
MTLLCATVASLALAGFGKLADIAGSRKSMVDFGNCPSPARSRFTFEQKAYRVSSAFCVLADIAIPISHVISLLRSLRSSEALSPRAG